MLGALCPHQRDIGVLEGVRLFAQDLDVLFVARHNRIKEVRDHEKVTSFVVEFKVVCGLWVGHFQ